MLQSTFTGGDEQNVGHPSEPCLRRIQSMTVDAGIELICCIYFSGNISLRYETSSFET